MKQNFSFTNHPILAETPYSRGRSLNSYSQLMRNRIIFLGTAIDDEVANRIVSQLLFLSNEDREAPIQMYINSPGGVIYSGLAIYDAMQVIPNPISTLVVGMAASFGTVLLTAGTKGMRYSLPNATIHMHQPLGGAQGQATEIEIQAKEILRLKARLNRILAGHTGQTLEAIQHDTERDRYLDAHQAVEYGLVDKVMEIPDIKKVKFPD